MFPKQDIYIAGQSSPKEVILKAPPVTRLSYFVLRGFGGGLISFVILVCLFIFGPIIKEEVFYDLGMKQNLVTISEASDINEVKKEAQTLKVDSYFSLVIPKIGAASNIIANVSPSDAKDYNDALQQGVAHAKGTYFPGMGKNIFFFSHSTNSEALMARYNAVFYLLRKLEKGDKIIVFFADKKYIYEVFDKKTVPANDTSYLTKTREDEQLILQTCDPPGTSWNRLLVFARPLTSKSN